MAKQWLRLLLSTALTASSIGAQQASLNDGQSHGDPPYLLDHGWTPLIVGTQLEGWTFEHPKKGIWTSTHAIYWDGKNAPEQLLSLPGGGDRISNGSKGAISNILTTKKFGDLELYLEFLIPAKSNSGVYLHGLYEVQVYDSYGVEHPKYIDCGAIYERWIHEKGVGGSPPLVNASRRPGEWQSFHIWFRGPRFDASGKKIAE
jgi:3-keto-disaccharide hydrolase